MDWKPCLYQFKMPGDMTESSLVTPPLWALMDHLVAVVYQIHSPDSQQPPPRVEQLEWTLYFLNSMRQDCDDTNHLNCLRRRIQSIINTSLRNPSLLFNTIPQEAVKASEGVESQRASVEGTDNQEGPGMSVPVTLQDILTHQPCHLSLMVNTAQKCNNPSKISTMKCATDAPGLARNHCGPDYCTVNQMNRSGNQECTQKVDGMGKEELSRYLHDLKKHQNEIISNEQKHLDLLNKIISKMD